MTDDIAFLAALAADPACDLTRLVYADWLDERSDPRGPLLRLEGRLFALPETSEAARELRRQLGELAAGVDVRWWAAVARVYAETGPAHPAGWRHPLTVAGAFYAGDWCCTSEACGPEAPGLIAMTGPAGEATFARQPATAAEVEGAVWALVYCPVRNLRYGGTDPLVIALLGNNPAFCDYVLAEDSAELIDALAEAALTGLEPLDEPGWRFWAGAVPGDRGMR